MRPGIVALRLIQAVFVMPPLVVGVGELVGGDLGRGLGSIIEASILFLLTEAALHMVVGFVEGWERPRPPTAQADHTAQDWLRERIREENDQSLQAFVRSMREEAAGRPTIRM